MTFDPKNTLGKFILDANGNPVAEPDLIKWAKWMEVGGRKLDHTSLLEDQVKISTVFLGMDHSYRNDGPPVLWETCIFIKKTPEAMIQDEKNNEALNKRFGRIPVSKYESDVVERYTSREDALKGHKKHTRTMQMRYMNLKLVVGGKEDNGL